MTIRDRGTARLAKLLADPDRAARVTAIREQMKNDDRTVAMNEFNLRNKENSD